MNVNEGRILEIERRLNSLYYAVDDLTQKVNELLQQLPRAWAQAGGSGGDGATKIYYAIGDGAAQATGTWPSITADSFTSDVYDVSSGSMVLLASSATIYWWDVDALATSGAIVKCFLNADGSSFTAILESCTDAT